MLPGRAPKGIPYVERTKYAANAIEAILRKMRYRGAALEDIEIIVAGGGNVLQKEDDTICRDNIEFVLTFLANKNLPVRARALGGTYRRCLSLDVKEGIVFYREGDNEEMELWRAVPIVKGTMINQNTRRRVGEVHRGW
jgi:chemotaxis receptor (MCP) glutamine deamidase CheD